ncbi:MAG TPA: HAD family acid phosphatase [Candidatus Baltobacteraceae bacterium]|nr:HAD family acid phosphatase [Candidatus Baltobacteraceae bacterium]
MIRSIAFRLLAPAFAVLLPAMASAAEPSNLALAKAQVAAYYTSGAWDRDVRARLTTARAYVDARVRAGVRKPAVVLDIDDTALSDYGYEKAHDFGYDARSYDADVRAERFPAIAPTLAFVRHVEAEHVAVFFVTGRRAPELSDTEGNLRRAGYPPYAGLFLRPVSDHARSVIPFKSHARAEIQHLGYTVLESVGDQWSDLRGGHAERTTKLPNPMYLIP